MEARSLLTGTELRREDAWQNTSDSITYRESHRSGLNRRPLDYESLVERWPSAQGFVRLRR